MWDLRWRFTYLDGKEDRFGVWNKPGTKANQAFFADKQYLARAFIEGKDENRNTKILLEVKGEDFVNFEFIAKSSVPMNIYSDNLKEIKLIPEIIGASITTRDHQYVIFRTGRRIKRILVDLNVRGKR